MSKIFIEQLLNNYILYCIYYTLEITDWTRWLLFNCSIWNCWSLHTNLKVRVMCGDKRYCSQVVSVLFIEQKVFGQDR